MFVFIVITKKRLQKEVWGPLQFDIWRIQLVSIIGTVFGQYVFSNSTLIANLVLSVLSLPPLTWEDRIFSREKFTRVYTQKFHKDDHSLVEGTNYGITQLDWDPCSVSDWLLHSLAFSRAINNQSQSVWMSVKFRLLLLFSTSFPRCTGGREKPGYELEEGYKMDTRRLT